jgi:hypothetical protein
MKLMMVLVPSDCLAEMQAVIERHEIHAYTEIPNVLGAGLSGRKLGTRAYPGTTSMILTILPAEQVEALVAAVKEFACDTPCKDEIRIFAMPAERVY